MKATGENTTGILPSQSDSIRTSATTTRTSPTATENSADDSMIPPSCASELPSSQSLPFLRADDESNTNDNEDNRNTNPNATTGGNNPIHQHYQALVTSFLRLKAAGSTSHPNRWTTKWNGEMSETRASVRSLSSPTMSSSSSMSLASCSGTGMSSANNEAHHPTITANENRNNTTRNASSIVATTSNSSTANTTAHTATNEERDGITPVRRHRSSNTGMLENRKFWLEPFRITNQTTATQPPFISTTATTTNETAPSSSSSPPPPPDQESISDPNKNHVLHQYVTSSHRTPPTTKTLIRRNPQTVFHALTDWIEAWTALCHSEELHALHFTTVQLVGTTGNVLWQTAIFLPVTVPTRIAKRTQRIVRWIWEGMMLRSKPQPRQLTAMGETTSTQGLSSINHETRGNKDSSTLTEQQSEQLQQLNHSNAGPLQLIFTVVTLPHRVALQAAESITREAGEIVRKVIQIDRPRTLQANRGILNI